MNSKEIDNNRIKSIEIKNKNKYEIKEEIKGDIGKLACLWLNHMKTFRFRDIYRIIDHYGDIVETYRMMSGDNKEMVLEEMVSGRFIKSSTRDEILRFDVEEWLDKMCDDMERTDVRYVTYLDEDYPEKLRDIPEYPLVLFYRGDLGITKLPYSIGIVGSRRPSFYGLNVAEEFSGELARKGMTVVSGMAYGIDSKSHQAAMEADGKTIAVLGGGVDICYPEVNFNIYSEMCEDHLVVSEYEPGTPHVSKNFPARNRIISGLSDGLLVVEAALRSGTLITADFALNQGKQIFAIPGRTSDILSKGSNNLIKQGAILVDSPIDIMVDILGTEYIREKNKVKQPDSGGYNNKKKNINNLTTVQRKLLAMLGHDPLYIDDLIRANDMKISETIQQMNELCRKGFADCVEKCYYILK
ncbi:MAG: DNA-processing protein DprA [Eubacterium sp.]|nr:DNA-processing protein DprA [Eubacterium sp.]